MILDDREPRGVQSLEAGLCNLSQLQIGIASDWHGTAVAVSLIGDFASALVTLSQRQEAVGEIWHVPSAETVTTREFIDMVYQQIQRPARLRVVPRIMIALLAPFTPPMRAVKETLYQSERPWVVDHGKFASAFARRPTSHEQAIAETLAWLQAKPTVSASH